MVVKCSPGGATVVNPPNVGFFPLNCRNSILLKVLKVSAKQCFVPRFVLFLLSDVEEDEAELFAKKRTRKMQRLPSGRAASKKVKTPTKKAQPYKVQLIDLDSDSAGSEEENKEQYVNS